MSGARLRVVPANEARFDDLQTIFGTGSARTCQCQRYKLGPGEAFVKFPTAERMDRLREQTACGDPSAESTSGLVSYLDDEPVGWCAVEPRTAYEGLVRNSNQTAWRDRDEDRSDDSVWAVTCVYVRQGYRWEGLSRELLAAAVEHARAAGARCLEGYPITTTDCIAAELHPGTEGAYAAAGFRVVARPSKRRAVMRLDL